MNIVLWVVAVVLALAFLAAGAMKLSRPKAGLAESGLGWVEDFSAGAVKGIGVVEVLGALGLVLPAVTGIAPVLVPLAATGLALTMVGAAVVHARRGETPMIAVNVVLLLLAAFVAWGRFGSYAF
ncbi:DoxX family protein [Phycicoccus jejuensis]|uniref:DoxX family protein n=1 Tax=Phycicoccus jejuensis TaxID=367299 RepID=UPI0004C39F2F|nr:DoxX family protein [Phycicoccus jejuensis]